MIGFLRRISFAAVIVQVFFSGGCAVHELRTVGDSVGEMREILWPPLPQTPRVRYVGSLSSPSDIGVRKSWLQKTFNTLMGKEEIAGRMVRPYGVFADGERVYVTDPGLGVLHIFDRREKRYSAITEAGGVRLVSPIGVVVDPGGEIFLTDSILRRVFVFDRTGRFMREIGSRDLFKRPAGITLDTDRCYVVDTHGHEVIVFRKKEGDVLFHMGGKGPGPGQLYFPTNIFPGENGELLVSDSLNFRVQIFDRNGNAVGAFGKQGDGTGNFSKPKGIAGDSVGHIYVADADFDAVQIFDREGQLLLGFGSSGKGAGELVLPAGMHIDPEDRIYVADSYNSRVQIFQFIGDKR